MEKVIEAVTAIRNIRAVWNIENKVKVDVIFSTSSDKEKDLLKENTQYIEQLAKCGIKSIEKGADRPEKSVAALVGKIKLFVPLGDAVDIDKEKGRIDKI